MIIFKAEADTPDIGGRLWQSVFLGDLMTPRKNLVFVSSKKSKKNRAFLEEKRIAALAFRQVLQLSPSRIELMVFNISHPDSDDKKILEWCMENNIPTLQIAAPGDTIVEASWVAGCGITGQAASSGICTGINCFPLHPRYIHFNRAVRKYRKHCRRVLVHLGRFENYRILRDTVHNLCNNGLQPTIAAGSNIKSSQKKTLRRIYKNIRFVGRANSLARAFYRADLALTEAGSSTIAAAAVGTPALYIYDTSAETGHAEKMEKLGAGLALCTPGDLNTIDLKPVLEKLDLGKRTQLGIQGKRLVDGKGSFRIISFLQTKNIIANNQKK